MVCPFQSMTQVAEYLTAVVRIIALGGVNGYTGGYGFPPLPLQRLFSPLSLPRAGIFFLPPPWGGSNHSFTARRPRPAVAPASGTAAVAPASAGSCAAPPGRSG